MAHDRQMERSETQIDSVTTSNLSKSYAAKLAEIITKSNVGRQQFTKEETKVAVAVFHEVLYGVVPEHRLNDCYVFVKRNRAGTFALAPEEIAAAWSQIRQSEMYKRAPDNRQITHGFCEKCNNTGSEPIRNERGVITSARKCTH